MCGIAGYVGTRALPQGAVDGCIVAMAHRGPDEFGAQRFEPHPGRHVVLINRRLRIVDLDARARQPLAHSGHTITYNGELYNYPEVRAELASAGVTFRTESDTEVLTAALATWGIGGLDRCEGMWAFALYAAADGSLTLCRDRFGEKPLYLFRDASGLYFASEIKALRTLIGTRLAVNQQQLTRYLVNGYKSLYKTAETFFAGVTELPARSWLRIDANGSETGGEYWTPRVCPRESLTYGEAVAGVRSRLEQAVERRLRADVPVAFCLSSGIDSNALAAIARKVFDYDVHAFTVVDPDPRYNEEALARLSAQALGMRHTEVRLTTANFLAELRRLVALHDGPVATISYFVHWQLMRAVAANGYRVAVSGTAADELLSGYYDHHLYYLHDIRADRPLHAAALEAWTRHVKPVIRNPMLRDPQRFDDNPGFRGHIYDEPSTFAQTLHAPWQEPFQERTYTTAGVLRNRMLNELFEEAVPVILHEDDLNAMSFSIENRSPYLDRDLFEFCGTIPTRHLMRDGFAKAILRDAVRDLLPLEIVENRRKIGFNASVLSLLDTSDPAVRAEVLADSPVYDIVRRDAVASLLDAPALDNARSKFLFSVLNVKMFLEQAA